MLLLPGGISTQVTIRHTCPCRIARGSSESQLSSPGARNDVV